jgi:hypothetical protein
LETPPDELAREKEPPLPPLREEPPRPPRFRPKNDFLPPFQFAPEDLLLSSLVCEGLGAAFLSSSRRRCHCWTSAAALGSGAGARLPLPPPPPPK